MIRHVRLSQRTKECYEGSGRLHPGPFPVPQPQVFSSLLSASKDERHE